MHGRGIGASYISEASKCSCDKQKAVGKITVAECLQKAESSSLKYERLTRYAYSGGLREVKRSNRAQVCELTSSVAVIKTD